MKAICMLYICGLVACGMMSPIANSAVPPGDKPAPPPQESGKAVAEKEAAAAPAPPSWKATFSSGVTVELAGVSESPSEGKPWWRPNGSPLAHAPKHYPPASEIPKIAQPGREFALRLTDVPFSHPQGDFDALIRIDPLPAPPPGGGLTGGIWVSQQMPPDFGKPLNRSQSQALKYSELRVAIQSFPGTQDHATIKAGLPAGPWATIVANGTNAGMSVQRPDCEVSFAAPAESNNAVSIDVAHNIPPDRQVRVVAALVDGKEVVGDRNPEVSTGHVRQITQSFKDLSIKDVKEFRLQTRPYEWVEFRNVSLRPGRRTDVQVIAGPASVAAVAPVSAKHSVRP